MLLFFISQQIIPGNDQQRVRLSNVFHCQHCRSYTPYIRNTPGRDFLDREEQSPRGNGSAFRLFTRSQMWGGLNLFSICPMDVLWMWNLFNKSSGENEISEHSSKFRSAVTLRCLRRIDHLLSEKHCGEKVHWAGIWFRLSVALCNKSWLLGRAAVTLTENVSSGMREEPFLMH